MATEGKAEPTELPDRIGKVAARALAHSGYTRYDQLTNVTPKDLLAIHGVGPKATRVLDEELRARGLSFAATGDGARPAREVPEPK